MNLRNVGDWTSRLKLSASWNINYIYIYIYTHVYKRSCKQPYIGVLFMKIFLEHFF